MWYESACMVWGPWRGREVGEEEGETRLGIAP